MVMPEFQPFGGSSDFGRFIEIPRKL